MPNTNFTYSDELYHHGIQGMKWGVRRYQNEDGSLTEEGKNRYHSGAKRIAKFESLAKKHRSNVTAKREAKIAKLNRKASKYRLKSAKAERSAQRLLFPETGSEAYRKMVKYKYKAERMSNKAEKLKLKQAKEAYSADKYEEKARKIAEKLQKEYMNVPISELNAEDISIIQKYLEK